MKGFGWKISGTILLAYVMAMVFVVPLGPGLLELQDQQMAGHSKRVNEKFSVYQVIGFGTHWLEHPEDLHVYLRHKKQLQPLEVLAVDDDFHASVLLQLPDTVPSQSWDVLITHPIDGTLSLENGFFANRGVKSETASWPTPEIIEFPSNLPFHFPYQPRIVESIRNLMLHVPLWFTMFLLMGIGFVASIKQLSRANQLEQDEIAQSSVEIGLLFGFLGLLTGSLWARFTWGAWWVDDPQLNGALVTVLVYSGYLVLRGSVENKQQRAKLASVYNLFAFVILVILLMVLPRFSESLHPGKGGNPGFNSYDLDSSLRMVFYPAVIGWMLVGFWMYRLNLRINRLNKKWKAWL